MLFCCLHLFSISCESTFVHLIQKWYASFLKSKFLFLKCCGISCSRICKQLLYEFLCTPKATDMYEHCFLSFPQLMQFVMIIQLFYVPQIGGIVQLSACIIHCFIMICG